MSDRSVSLSVGLCFLCLYLLTAGGHYGGDGFWSYLTAESIVLDRDLTIGDRPFLIEEMVNQYDPAGDGGVAAAHGRRYSKVGLGLALIEVPFYAIGHLLALLFPSVPRDYVTMFFTSMTNVFVCALWCLVFFGFARRFERDRKRRLWITGIFGAGSLLFPYAGYGFSEPLVGLSLLGAVWALHHYRSSKALWTLAVAGGLVGLAAATKLYFVITLPFLAAYHWAGTRSEPEGRRRSAWIVPMLPLVLFGILIAWHNWTRYGNIAYTGYHLDDLSSHLLTGKEGGYFTFSPFNVGIALYGLLLSSGRGLLFFLPVAFLTPMALKRFGRAHRQEALLFASLILLHLLFFSSFRPWHGGSCWGPRYLLPIVPFLILPLAALLKEAAARATLVKAVGIAGGLIQLPAALTNFHLFIRFVHEHRVGGLIFFSRQPGDPLFSPGLSPIAGAFCQLASAISRLVTGQALAYPVPSWAGGGLASMASYDLIDIWWVNALRTGFLSDPAAVGLGAVVALLLVAWVLSARKVIQWAGTTTAGER